MTITIRNSGLSYGTDPIANAVRTSMMPSAMTAARRESDAASATRTPLDLAALYPSLFAPVRAARPRFSLRRLAVQPS